jgi:hypothetical protein
MRLMHPIMTAFTPPTLKTSYKEKRHLNIEFNTAKLWKLGLSIDMRSGVGKKSSMDFGRTPIKKPDGWSSRLHPPQKRQMQTSTSSPYVS